MLDVVLATDTTLCEVPTEENHLRLQLFYEESLLLNSLRECGLIAKRVPWDAPFDWTTTRCCIIRSTRNYIDLLEPFYDWIEEVSKQCTLINAKDACFGNIDKKYLLELEKEGVPIIPTVLITKNEVVDFESLYNRFSTQIIVIKPAISISGFNTFKIRKWEVDEYRDIINQLVSNQDMLAQPYVKAFADQGEFSFMLIDGKVTHSVLKVAKEGEFRIHDSRGGIVLPYTATNSERKFAENVFSKYNCTKPLYARVDAVYDEHEQLRLVEYELLEPELFFRFDRRSADCLAHAIRKLLRNC